MKSPRPAELDTWLRKSEAHARKYPTDYGQITQGMMRMHNEQGYLAIAVSTAMIPRAMKILESFILKLYNAGLSVTVDDKPHFHCPGSAIIVDGEHIPFKVREKQYRTTTSSYGTDYRTTKPSGLLEIEIYGADSSWKPSKAYTDTEYTKLEDKLDDIIPYLRKTAVHVRERRLEDEQWQRKRHEEERIRKEHESQIDARAKTAMNILKIISQYRKACTLRGYCDIMEEKFPKEEFADMIAVARSVADWIDPTLAHEDELLSERYSVENFLSIFPV